MSLNLERVRMIRKMWGQLRVPVRPGIEGLELYRFQIQQFATKDILILGATPELIDMALELNADKVVSVERNPEVIEAMRQLGTQDWSRVQLIEGDWLEERPEFIGAFSCIVCDGGLLFLEYPGQWEQLFKLIHSYLMPGGVFIAKEWAEPIGQRDYDQFVAEMIDEFETNSVHQSPIERIESYTYLASELRLAIFIHATLDNASFDQELLVKRADALCEKLVQKFPDPQMVQTTESALKYLARSEPGRTDTVAGARFDKADELLSRQGFRSEHFPLPDRPISGANYMFVSRK